MSREERVTWCGLCHARCGLVLELENGRAVAVRGDSEHPANRGRTCRRGRMILEHLYHPDRVDLPLRRTGERGGGGWETVSWEQALDDIAHRLEKLRAAHGAEALAFSRGTYRTYHWDARRFLNLFGSPNTTGANPVCHCPSVAVESAICGAHPDPDLDHAQCIVWWGANRAITGPLSDWPALRAARERGARLITVDPRRTAEAEMADLWLQIRPGTDAALMLAWIHVICEEGLYDRDFVERWTVGFDEVRELANQMAPAEAARLTWVPEEQIVAAARLYATSKPATLRGGQGIEKAGPGFLSAVHAKAILRALSGNLDVVGGDRFGGAEGPSRLVSNLEMELNEALPPAQRAKLLGADAYPLHSFAAWERMVENTEPFPKSYVRPTDAAEVVAAHPHAVFNAILSDRPYPVRALICQAANPLLTLADPRRTFAALKALDLLVVMDYYMTPTAAMADYVLPAASTVERDDLAVFGSGCIAYPMGIEPLAERRSDYEMWMELGRRLGQAEHWPWDTMAEVCEHRLAPAGLDFEQLKARRAWFEPAAVGRSRELGFATASGKVELRSSLLEDLGCPPLPSIVKPEDTAHSDFPLTLITGNGFDPMYNSEQRQWPTARRAVPDPLLTLHPKTAAGLGLADGDWVRLETATGAVRQRLETSDAIHPQMVDSQQGWWFPERQGEPEEPFGFLVSNVNALVLDDPEHCSPGTGSWQQTGIPCRVVADPD